MNKDIKRETPGITIAGFVLGIFSFIPGFGLFLGILAVIFSAIGLSKVRKHNAGGKKRAIAGLILGIAGVLFTIGIYGLMFYFFFASRSGPFLDIRVEVSQQTLTQNAGLLELYKKKHGRYPDTLDDLEGQSYMAPPTDHFLNPLYYSVSRDGQEYNIRSLGPDGKFGTQDDIFPAE